MYDNLENCSKCGSDACYVKKPSKDVTLEWCLGCGFVSNTLLIRDTEFWDEQMEILPELNKFLMVEEEDTGKVWMPSFIHYPELGMVFANGTSPETWKWGAVKTILMTAEEQEKLKTEEKYKADYSTLKEFDEKDYMEALDYVGILGQPL